jgi:isoquinoline 1-oxidoreductase
VPLLRLSENHGGDQAGISRGDGMNNQSSNDLVETMDDPNQVIEPVGYDFGVSRRSFVQMLGAGLIIATGASALGQTPPRGAPESARQRTRAESRRRGGRGREVPVDARLHIGTDGTLTVMTGKVEAGQGARAEISAAAAEELRVPVSSVRLLMADTLLTPDDGITAGSRTTPSTLPSVRQGCAAAREMLAQSAGKRWNIPPDQVQISHGAARYQGKTFGYADLASEQSSDAWKSAGSGVTVTPVAQWQVLGKPSARPDARDLVTGAHKCPCDIIRPEMLYAKVLRPPAYNATLKEIGLEPGSKLDDDGVIGVRDKDFVAVAAPTTHAARKVIAQMSAVAKWEIPTAISSDELYPYLRKHADVPANPFADEAPSGGKKLSATYCVPYIQHAPLEPRSAVAEWDKQGKLTIWTSTQNPFGVRRELAGAFHIPEQDVRVIVPDFGGAFGGKHTGECAIEAARIAKTAKRPVALHWTRQEEFTWAYFRPAGVIDVAAAIDGSGKLANWYFIIINSGPSALETPYRVEKTEQHYVHSDPPLRHGSYRALAATANTFARESFMDELAQLGGQEPLAFRLGNLENPRLRAVLEEACKRFGWSERIAKKRDANHGIGLACGTDKGSFVAACAEVAINPSKQTIAVRKVCQVFECGAITNPSNLHSQVQGAIVMGIGPALREAIRFEHGKVTNASFYEYQVPRFADVPPEIDVHLLDRRDIPSAGAGEIPLIAIAPAINNAVCDAMGKRLRELPLKPTIA